MWLETIPYLVASNPEIKTTKSFNPIWTRWNEYEFNKYRIILF